MVVGKLIASSSGVKGSRTAVQDKRRRYWKVLSVSASHAVQTLRLIQRRERLGTRNASQGQAIHLPCSGHLADLPTRDGSSVSRAAVQSSAPSHSGRRARSRATLVTRILSSSNEHLLMPHVGNRTNLPIASYVLRAHRRCTSTARSKTVRTCSAKAGSSSPIK
jgi:hypothetical protein